VLTVKAHPSLAAVGADVALERVECVLGRHVRPGSDPWAELFDRPADELQAEFVANWIDAFSTPGSSLLASVVEDAKANPLPIGTKYRRIANYLLFLNVVYRLGRIKGRSSVRLGTRQIGAAMALSYDTIANYAKMASDEGLISKTEDAVYRPGGGGRLAEYSVNLSAFQFEN
jgi:hypothetical protein